MSTCCTTSDMTCCSVAWGFVFFFFQAEDGIRDAQDEELRTQDPERAQGDPAHHGAEPRYAGRPARSGVAGIGGRAERPGRAASRNTGEPRSHRGPTLHVLQRRPRSSDTPRDARDGGWHRGSRLVDCGNRRAAWSLTNGNDGELFRNEERL